MCFAFSYGYHHSAGRTGQCTQQRTVNGKIGARHAPILFHRLGALLIAA